MGEVFLLEIHPILFYQHALLWVHPVMMRVPVERIRPDFQWLCGCFDSADSCGRCPFEMHGGKDEFDRIRGHCPSFQHPSVHGGACDSRTTPGFAQGGDGRPIGDEQASLGIRGHR